MNIRSVRIATQAVIAFVFAGVAGGPSDAIAQLAAPVTLSWTAPGDDGTVGWASSYDIRYQTVGITGTDTTTWWISATQVAGEPTPSVAFATDSMQVSGLTIGATYYFMIRASDEVPNVSGFSNVASTTVLSCDAPTNAPSNVAADEDTAAVDVLLSWSGTPSPSDPAVSVRVYRATGSSGSFSLGATLPGTPTTYRDTNVSAGTAYRYQVAWAIACGDGPRSATATITPVAPPGGPPAPGNVGASLHVYPNPSSGPLQLVIKVVGSAPAQARIRLYTLTGRWIADLVDGTYDPGEHTVSWSRGSRSGNPVSPGYYEAIGTVGGNRVRERIVLLP